MHKGNLGFFISRAAMAKASHFIYGGEVEKAETIF